MYDVERQLAAYADSVVERVDAGDVVARIAIAEQSARKSRGLRLRHLAWAAGGAATVLVAIGLAAWLGVSSGGPGRPFLGGEGSGAGSTASIAVIVVLGLGGAAAVVAGMAALLPFVTRGGVEMRTMERPVEVVESAVKPNRYLVAALGAMVLLVVGFGTWLLVDEYTGVDRQIEVLVHDWYDAWDRGDVDGVLAPMSPTAKHYDQFAPDGIGGERLADRVRGVAASDFSVAGEPLIIQQSEFVYLVSVRAAIDEWVPMSVFRIREVNGEMQISMHRWIN